MDQYPNKQNNTICPICKRNVPEQYLERHHTIPKSKGGKETISVCVNCGDTIHQLINIKELKTTYNTIEALNSHPDIQKWSKWIFKKPNDFSVSMKKKKKK